MAIDARAMKLLVAVVVMIGCGGAPARTSAPAEPTRQAASAAELEMLVTIDGFLKAPFAQTDAMARIKKFVIESKDVHVIFDEQAMPILVEDGDQTVKSMLAVGFMAGNAAAQIRTGIRKNDVLAGVTGELRIYRALKVAAPRLGLPVTSPGLERLLALEDRGELRAYLARPAPPAPPPPAPTDDEAEPTDLLKQGLGLARAGRVADALAVLERVVAFYEGRYAGEKRRIYCVSSKSEALAYLTTAAAEQTEAIALTSTWSDALLGKSFALTELGRRDEARRALQRAVQLSPFHALYLSELGYLAIQDKDWKLALERYTSAADHVDLIEDPELRRSAHTRALRGQGYAYLELGDLDASERAYKASLAIDPSDDKSKAELQFLWDLRAKRK